MRNILMTLFMTICAPSLFWGICICGIAPPGMLPPTLEKFAGFMSATPSKGEPETIRESPPSRSAFAEQRQTHAQPGIPFERTGMADSGKGVSKTTRGESEPRCPPRKSVYAIGGEHDTTGTTRERRADSRREREREMRKQRNEGFEVDRGWDSWDFDRRLKFRRRTYYSQGLTMTMTENNNKRLVG